MGLCKAMEQCTRESGVGKTVFLISDTEISETLPGIYHPGHPNGTIHI